MPEYDYYDDCSRWGQVWISFHHVFLRTGPLVGDAIRDVFVDILDFGDLWLRWGHDELYIADFHGFISPRGSGSNASHLGQLMIWVLVTVLNCLGIGRLIGIICWPHVNMCYFMNGQG